MDDDSSVYTTYDPSFVNNPNQYIIEGGLSFQQLLNNDTDDEDETVEKCLISNMPLDNTRIELNCNHSFNYFYLYKEIFTQKYGNCKYNSHKDKSYNKHNFPCIQCPYCRVTTYKLLPRSLDLKCPDKLNINIPSTYCITINCSIENCRKQPYVTQNGYLCLEHYRDYKKNKPKERKVKKANSEKTNKKNTNVIMDSSMNTIIDSSINAIIDSSMNNFTTNNKASKKPVVENKLFNMLLEYGKYPEHFTDEMKAYTKNHTVEYMKNILKANFKKCSGLKIDLVDRIFSNNLQEYILYN
jgi:hypothetical protein